jgi:hypothetical protein
MKKKSKISEPAPPARFTGKWWIEYAKQKYVSWPSIFETEVVRLNGESILNMRFNTLIEFVRCMPFHKTTQKTAFWLSVTTQIRSTE